MFVSDPRMPIGVNAATMAMKMVNITVEVAGVRKIG